jgi:hypothetical protein
MRYGILPSALQLLVDILLSSGHPSDVPKLVPRPHIPILACNMDLQWMAEAVMPRLVYIYSFLREVVV